MATDRTTDGGYIAPVVHLNGSSGVELTARLERAINRVREALEALPPPHARDYYVQSDAAYARAEREHAARQMALRSVAEQLEGIYENVSDQVAAHESSR